MLKVVEVGDVACEVRSLPVAPLFLLFDMQDEDLSTSDLSETVGRKPRALADSRARELRSTTFPGRCGELIRYGIR